MQADIPKDKRVNVKLPPDAHVDLVWLAKGPPKQNVSTWLAEHIRAAAKERRRAEREERQARAQIKRKGRHANN